MLSLVVVFGALLADRSAAGSSPPSIAGEYVCKAGCRVTDAAPSIEIIGPVANCMSELGGIYTGKRLTDRSVACFNMIGSLAEDGKTVLWSNGEVWERLPARPSAKPP